MCEKYSYKKIKISDAVVLNGYNGGFVIHINNCSEYELEIANFYCDKNQIICLMQFYIHLIIYIQLTKFNWIKYLEHMQNISIENIRREKAKNNSVCTTIKIKPKTPETFA